MDLRRRLANLDRTTARPAAAPRDGAAGGGGRGGGDGELPAELGLRELATPAGPCWYREWREPQPAPAPMLPELAGILSRAGCDPAARDRLLLVDTETTGLAGGTGTLAFLVGVGWWEGDDLVVRQLFLPAPGREGGLLAALAEWAAPFAAAVTYNGASFDLPLLRTRALMNRRADPLGHLESWDLLPASRRLWGRRLADCRQQTVEAGVCGIERGPGDIEGARIPEVWREWLGGGDCSDLLCVLRHNHRDIRGMAGILGSICAARDELECPAAPGPGDPHRAWALARIAERRREAGRAADWIAVALARPALADPAAGRQLAADGVRLLKRAGRWAELESLLEALVAGGAGPWAHREAAILYERRLGRLGRALRHAAQAGEPARVARLQRRLARAATQGEAGT